MALASRLSGDIHDKTGSDLTDLRTKYTNNKHIDLLEFEGEAALMYQIQLLREDIDELRRYIVSAELLLPDTMGDSIPTSDPASAGQLWNNRGVLNISRG